MSETETIGSIDIAPRDAEYFPRSPEAELQHIQNLSEGLPVEVKPIGDKGYLIHNNGLPVVAEAPWIAFDFDDTAAQTVQDKERCWAKLEEMGFDKSVIDLCDKESRIYIGDTEKTYEPELDIRLLSVASKFRNAEGRISLSEELRIAFQQAKEQMLAKDGIATVDPDEGIEELFHQTRFRSTLYDDAIDSLRMLRGEGDRPRNIAILTYGDPSFQAEKVMPLIREGVINQVWLTKVRKGPFFEKLVTQNPFKDIPLQYTYDETPRGNGIQFKDWCIGVTLFDDDPSQVKSFNSVAQKAGISGLGVMRVRRPGVKRAEKDTDVGRMVGEIKQHESETFLDPAIFRAAQAELEVRQVEDYVVNTIKGGNGEIPVRAVELIANTQEIGIEEAKAKLLTRLGYEHALTVPTDNPDRQTDYWVQNEEKEPS